MGPDKCLSASYRPHPTGGPTTGRHLLPPWWPVFNSLCAPNLEWGGGGGDARRRAARRKDSRRAERKLSRKSEFRHRIYLRNLGLVLVSGVAAVVGAEEEDEEEEEEEAAS